VPNCVLLDAARAGATAQLVTKGGVTVGLQGEGPIGMAVERPDGAERGENVDGVLDPKADLVLNIGPLDGPRDGGAVRLTLPRGITRLCGVS
jgi:hypothetical protein